MALFLRVCFVSLVLIASNGLSTEHYTDILSEIKIIEKATCFLNASHTRLDYETSLEAIIQAITDGHNSLVLWRRKIDSSQTKDNLGIYNKTLARYKEAVKKFYQSRLHYYEVQNKKEPKVSGEKTFVLQTYDITDVAQERNQEIDHLAREMEEIHELMLTISALVVEQGELMEQVDGNLKQAVRCTKKAIAELEKSSL